MSRIMNRNVVLGLVVALGSACGAKDDSQTDTTSSTDPSTSSTSPTTNSTANKVATANSLGDLRLSGALSIVLPEAFGGGSGGNLRLLAGKKSREACMMGATIKEEIRRVGEVGGFFCHLELEKDRIKFGKKYKIMSSFGEFARIFVDNSKSSEGKLTIGFCSTMNDDGGTYQSRQLIAIDGLTDAGPKGSIISDGKGTIEGTESSFGGSSSFDMSVAGIVGLVAKSVHADPSSSYSRAVDLSLSNSGKSILKLASKGANGGVEFFDRGVAFTDSEQGSAVFNSKGTYNNQTTQFSRRASFTKAGDVIAENSVKAELLPAISDMPAYLPEGFKADAPTGWVGANCADVDEEVVLDPTSPAHNACDKEWGDDVGACWGSNEYEDSTSSIDIPE